MGAFENQCSELAKEEIIDMLGHRLDEVRALTSENARLRDALGKAREALAHFIGEHETCDLGECAEAETFDIAAAALTAINAALPRKERGDD